MPHLNMYIRTKFLPGGNASGRFGPDARAGQIAAKDVDLTVATDLSEWGSVAAVGLKPANKREISVARIWPVLLWTLGLSAGLAGPVAAQNLDAGKPPSQIFAEACAGCHRS